MSNLESFDVNKALDLCVVELEKLIDKGDQAKELLREVHMLRRDFIKGHKTREEVLHLVDEVDDLTLNV